ncbi:MAG: rhomboid family intramembrane serine protease [Sedimentisphaerales bacterium]|nr:rhomboid family intramembrane serine protease [Sedimentisphaerales bacterium]
MNCPSCSHKLRRIKVKSDVLDICPHCKGIWFDSGEFVTFFRELAKSDGVLPEKTRLFERRQVQNTNETIENDKSCPRCDIPMQTFNYCYDSNVFLEKCPNCHGIWADGGDVFKIAQYIKQDSTAVKIGADLARQAEKLEHIKEIGQLGRELMQSTNIGMYYMPRLILPLSDEEECMRFPVITVSIILLCVLTFLAEVLWIRDAEEFFRIFGFIAGDFFSVGLITSMFLHAGILHLIGNMYFLWLFGDNVEDRLGRIWYTVFYLFSGTAASILHSIFNHNSSIPAIGASGAISGVMGAYMIFYPYAKVRILFITRIVGVPAWIFMGIWFLLQLVFGLIHNITDYSNIAWFAHIGGFVFGITAAYLKNRMAQRHG